MNFAELQKAADAAMLKSLSRTGFLRTSAGTWNRLSNGELNVIQLQKHSSEKSFCVNLGVHYTFLPKAGTEISLSDGEMEVSDCELKLRLTDQATVSDQWWPLETPSVDHVAELVRSKGLPIFDFIQTRWRNFYDGW